MAESRSWSACAGPRRGSGLWRLLCTPSSWDGQNGSLTGRDSRGVSLPQQPPILHASSDSVVEASPTSSFMELSGSGAGADMWWMQARCAGRRPSRPRCAGRLRSAKEELSMCQMGVKQGSATHIDTFLTSANGQHGATWDKLQGKQRYCKAKANGGTRGFAPRRATTGHPATQTDGQPARQHTACCLWTHRPLWACARACAVTLSGNRGQLPCGELS